MLCEFILNSTRSPPGEEFLYHILLELYLTGSLQDAPGSPSGVKADSAVQSPATGTPEMAPHCVQTSAGCPEAVLEGEGFSALSMQALLQLNCSLGF